MFCPFEIATSKKLVFALVVFVTSPSLVHAQALTIPKFAEETISAGIDSRFGNEDDEFLVGGGVATFNCDESGAPSLYLTAGANRSKFYRNVSKVGGSLKFVEETSGLEATNAIGAYPIDIDGDGKTDLVVLRVGEVQVYRGLGNCRFEPANDRWNIHTPQHWHTAFSATWEVGNKLPTLAFGTYTDLNRKRYPWGTCTPAVIYRPEATAVRYGAPMRLEPSFCSLSMLFSDWNRSGHADLRVANDREYYKNGREQLWQMLSGKPPRSFLQSDGFKPMQIWGMGIASMDLDGTGYPEVFITSMADNKLQKLDSTEGVLKPSYTDVAFKRGATAHRPYVGGEIKPSTAWHAQFEDVNNDGYADLWIVKGNVSTMADFALRDTNDLLLQKHDGSFEEVGDKAGIVTYLTGRGGMLVDFNGDGMLDMVVVNRLTNATLWRNVSEGLGGWLQVRLQEDDANRDAIGAWIEVDLGGRVIRRENTIGGGHASGHLGWLHFGLGDAQDVKVRVQWPNNEGHWSPWQVVSPNNFYVVDKATGVMQWSAPAPDLTGTPATINAVLRVNQDSSGTAPK
jgi:enediyne biosynthesis protein E4